ncbi:unnamed protein product [Vitrella brassicaformis CCMP3155]|uniref:Uncharacterized protein n=1 Tax=Vitrella brassicaformis (strain CCMP3155) TaxID=1169540 RepID=A0A0G4GCA4_VITBC|nr:unnamed protein product [Vitrella brassicaformis CCMP3155]|eukprot:CEM26476.1 unnamed protein product [Vitrella brassicaformis CCMP3155]
MHTYVTHVFVEAKDHSEAEFMSMGADCDAGMGTGASGGAGGVFRSTRIPPAEENRTDAAPERHAEDEETEEDEGWVKHRVMFPTKGLPWMVKAARKETKKRSTKAKWGRAGLI